MSAATVPAHLGSSTSDRRDFTEYAAQLARLRTLILVVAAGVTIFGTVMVFSASTVLSYKNHGNAYNYGLRHAGSVVLGAGFGYLVSRVPRRVWPRLSNLYLIVVAAALVIVFIRGAAIGGQRNWIPVFGTTMQPSEFAKLAIVLSLARLLAVNQARNYSWQQLWLGAIVLGGGLTGMVVIGGDLGTPMIMGMLCLLMLFIAGASLKPFVYITCAVLAAGVMMVLTKGYRMDRITAWFDPFAQPETAGYQSVHGQFALGGGGILGQGLGSGREKWGGLPAAHTDFILAAIGEETGLIGATLVVAALVTLAIALFRLSLLHQDRFARYVCSGLAIWLAIQSIVNIAMVVGFAPVVGVTLPLVSFGGSSMIATLTAIGVAVAFTRPDSA